MPSSSLVYLGAAFAIAWVLIAAYVVRLARLQRDITRRLDALDRRPPTPQS